MFIWKIFSDLFHLICQTNGGQGDQGVEAPAPNPAKDEMGIEFPGAGNEAPDSTNEKPEQEPPPDPQKVIRRFQVKIDPGHHAGIVNRSPRQEDGSYFYEWESNWRFAHALADQLTALGFETEITFPDAPEMRNKVETAAQYEKRVAPVLNSAPGSWQLFISIHSNADGEPDPEKWGTSHGLEVFVHPDAPFICRDAAIEMTDAMLLTLLPASRDRSFGEGYKVKRLIVLKRLLHRPNTIAMLIEVEFHDSDRGLFRLKKPEWRERAVEGMVEGVLRIEKMIAEWDEVSI